MKTGGEELFFFSIFLLLLFFSPPEARPRHFAHLIPAMLHTLVIPDLVAFLLSPPPTLPLGLEKPMLSSSKKPQPKPNQR